MQPPDDVAAQLFELWDKFRKLRPTTDMRAMGPNTITTCHACGKLIPNSRKALCGVCALVPEYRFALVRDWLRDHQGATVAEVMRATGVSHGDVEGYLSGGRLTSNDRP